MRLIDADAIKDPFEGTSEQGGWISKLFFLAVSIQPTIDPIKHGHWIDDEFTSKTRCSECGEEWSWFDNDSNTFKYCPNCGAKMDEVSE